LYSVSPVDNIDKLPARPANYGFHIYQLETRKTRQINLPGHYLAWLPGGDFLLVSSEEKPLEKRLLRFTPGDAESKPVANRRGWYGAVHLNGDGRWVVAALPQRSPNESVSQIVKIDLANGDMTNITPKGKFAEYQSPRLSPSGRHISYIRNEEIASAKWRKATLMVDQKPLQEIVGYLKHGWIDDQSIVFLNRKAKELVVLDSNSGEEKGRRKL
jgi:Tol biopolymer transport system component